jgi:peroxiredoxin
MKRMGQWLWSAAVGGTALSGLGITMVRLAPGTVSFPSSPSLRAERFGVGSMAPDFILSDQNGNTHQLSRYRGRKVLLSFFCGCRLCEEVAREWQKQFGNSHGVQLLAVANFSPASATEFRSQTGTRFPLLLDAFGMVAKRYESSSCPRCWLIDQNGRVTFTNRGRTDRIDVLRREVRKLVGLQP